MKLATWNVNSITARLPLVTRWIEEARPDVLCLQEIKCTDDRFPVVVGLAPLSPLHAGDLDAFRPRRDVMVIGGTADENAAAVRRVR